jgi:hypothetical protein
MKTKSNAAEEKAIVRTAPVGYMHIRLFTFSLAKRKITWENRANATAVRAGALKYIDGNHHQHNDPQSGSNACRQLACN